MVLQETLVLNTEYSINIYKDMNWQLCFVLFVLFKMHETAGTVQAVTCWQSPASSYHYKFRAISAALSLASSDPPNTLPHPPYLNPATHLLPTSLSYIQPLECQLPWCRCQT